MSGHCVNGIFFNRAEKDNLGGSSFDELCPGLEVILEEAEAKRNVEINVPSICHNNIRTVSNAEPLPARKEMRRNGPETSQHQKDRVNLLETKVIDAVQDLTTKVTDFKDANRALERMSDTGSTPEARLAYQKERVNALRTAILDGIKDMSSIWGELQDAQEAVAPHH